MLEQVETLDRQIRELETELDAIAKTQPNVARLRTIPGVGPRTAEAIVAFTDSVSRFKRGNPYGSSFGMTPTPDASGGVDPHGHIRKRGPRVVRWVLVEAAHPCVRQCPPFRRFFDRIHRGKKDRYKKAIVATGHKMLRIRFAMRRDQTVFDPARVLGSTA